MEFLLRIVLFVAKITGIRFLLRIVVSFVGKKILNDEERNFSDEAKSLILKQFADTDEDFTFINALVAPGIFIDQNENPIVSEELKSSEIDYGWKKDSLGKWIKGKVQTFTQKVSDRFVIKMLGQDDLMNNNFDFAEQLTMEVMKGKFLFPPTDLDYISDRKEATKIMNELGLSEGKAMPVTYNTDFNMETDESFSRIFFYGIGCVLL